MHSCNVCILLGSESGLIITIWICQNLEMHHPVNSTQSNSKRIAKKDNKVKYSYYLEKSISSRLCNSLPKFDGSPFRNSCQLLLESHCCQLVLLSTLHRLLDQNSFFVDVLFLANLLELLLVSSQQHLRGIASGAGIVAHRMLSWYLI